MEYLTTTTIFGIGALVFALLTLLLYKQVLRLFGVVLVPDSSIGIVNKKFVLFGSHKTLGEGEIVALKGEAGIQADTLPPGVHFFKWPWQYHVRLEEFVEIEEGKIGRVESRAGAPLAGGRVLSLKRIDCQAFQNTRAFLEGGGERGPQATIIPPGTYRINTDVFEVFDVDVTEIPSGKVGILRTMEGNPLASGEIAGSEVPGHNNFQDPIAFVENGGSKGLQEQVLLSGRYFINPLFAQIELEEMTTVQIATVGVVIAYVGKEGKDVTGDAFQHGNLVNRGEKGVWVEPLDPGKYPINTRTHKIEHVPTANVVLNWANSKTEAHNLDKNLSTITVRSSDGFTFNLDVSQIIHIPRADAPKVIARFGNMTNLVTQVLEPTIGNYFRNSAQSSDVIVFLKERTARQNEAKTSIKAALTDYNVMAVDTLIGDITPPQELMKTLTDRKVAEQRKVTYDTQRLAEETRKELQQATATADTQAGVVAAERSVEIATFTANAAVKESEGKALARRQEADGESYYTTTVGSAEAGKTLAVGSAEADVIKLKIASMDAGNYAGIEIAKALANSANPIVPEMMLGGADGGGGITALLIAGALKNLKDEKKAA